MKALFSNFNKIMLQDDFDTVESQSIQLPEMVEVGPQVNAANKF